MDQEGNGFDGRLGAGDPFRIPGPTGRVVSPLYRLSYVGPFAVPDGGYGGAARPGNIPKAGGIPSETRQNDPAIRGDFGFPVFLFQHGHYQ